MSRLGAIGLTPTYGDAIRLMLPVAAIGIIATLPLQMLWMRLLGYLG
jgi:hypothetical protein